MYGLGEQEILRATSEDIWEGDSANAHEKRSDTMKSSSLQPPNVSLIVATQRRLTELSIRLALEGRETADRELLKETLDSLEEASHRLDQAWQRLTGGRIRVAADR